MWHFWELFASDFRAILDWCGETKASSNIPGGSDTNISYLCVWNIWRDVKLLPDDAFFSLLGLTLGNLLLLTLWLFWMLFHVISVFEAGELGTLWLTQFNEARSQSGISGLAIQTYLHFSICCQWQPAKPRIGMSIICLPVFQFSLRCCRNLSRWERFGLV